MLQMMMEDLPPNAEHSYMCGSDMQHTQFQENPSFLTSGDVCYSPTIPGLEPHNTGLSSLCQPSSGAFLTPQSGGDSRSAMRGYSSYKRRVAPYLSMPYGIERSNPSIDTLDSTAQYHNRMHNHNLYGNTGNCNNNNNNSYSATNYSYPSSPRQFHQVSTNVTALHNPSSGQQHSLGLNQYSSLLNRDPVPQQILQQNYYSNVNNNCTMSYRISSPDSYDARKKISPDTKKRVTKKRKKKGLNEPQRPVSAYALFFRDTQAAIKAENSSATFGEISKIVASMWDSLSEEAKQVYKQKTETAKRDYLKHLAAFRANMISKGGIDAEEEDSQPLSVLREKMAEQKATSSSPVQSTSNAINSVSSVIDLTETADDGIPLPPKLHPAPVVTQTGGQTSETPSFSIQQNISQMVSSAPRSVSPALVLTKIIVPGQNGAQPTIHVINPIPATRLSQSGQMAPPSSNTPVKHIILRPISTSPKPSSTLAAATPVTPSPPPPIQLRNIVSQTANPFAILPNKQGQIIKMLPSETGGVTFSSVPSTSMKGKLIKMVNVVQPVRSTIVGANETKELFSTEEQSSSLRNQQVQPILQLLEQETSSAVNNSQMSYKVNMECMASSIPDSGRKDEEIEVDERALMSIPQQNLLHTDATATVVGIETDSTNENTFDSVRNEEYQNDCTRRCVRDGCNNVAVSCPYWDNEYCSNECVYSHCRDVFDAWVSARQVSTSVI